MKNPIFIFLILVCSAGLFSCKQLTKAEPDNTRADVVIYGGTSSAVIAAVQVAKMGKSVVLVSPAKHLGGLSSSGLGYTDTGNKAVIGGLARDGPNYK
jgi:ribulose 1,5-bisphosphate synthetase/thiazole synthase